MHEIFQARILEWVAMPSFRGSFRPRDGTVSFLSPEFANRFFTTGSHGGRSLVVYSPWGLKESDRTERFHFHFHSYEKGFVGGSSGKESAY